MEVKYSSTRSMYSAFLYMGDHPLKLLALNTLGRMYLVPELKRQVKDEISIKKEFKSKKYETVFLKHFPQAARPCEKSLSREIYLSNIYFRIL